ncbi:hypothetical protein BJ508DRAFT_305655 [Ascobolus immersus RN42]|uniref:Apple domain-containing protein n=1 Tax=Ascobolus immersus RN42 TaxID=1160509 RepID=A0A3N4I8X0_ASCIM|nr:hypothetical protein BJ508DRAFT_305655 [Ascobolus immersus RN42]
MRASFTIILLTVLLNGSVLASPVAAPIPEPTVTPPQPVSPDPKCTKLPSKNVQEVIRKLGKSGVSACQFLLFGKSDGYLVTTTTSSQTVATRAGGITTKEVPITKIVTKKTTIPTTSTVYTATVTITASGSPEPEPSTDGKESTITYVKRQANSNWKLSVPASLFHHAYDELVFACKCIGVAKPVAKTQTRTSVSTSISYSKSTIPIYKVVEVSTSFSTFYSTRYFSTATTTTVPPAIVTPEVECNAASFHMPYFQNAQQARELNLPASSFCYCSERCFSTRNCVGGYFTAPAFCKIYVDEGTGTAWEVIDHDHPRCDFSAMNFNLGPLVPHSELPSPDVEPVGGWDNNIRAYFLGPCGNPRGEQKR